MRVLHVIHDNPFQTPGGAQIYCLALAREEAGQGHAVSIFFLDHCSGRAGQMAQESRSELSLYIGNLDRMPRLRSGFQFRNSYDNPDACTLFQATLDDFKPDVVHIHSLILLSYRFPAMARDSGATVLWTLHDYWPLCHRIVLLDNEGDLCHGSRDGSRCTHCGKDLYNRWPGRLLQPALRLAFRRRNQRLLEALGRAKLLLAPSKYLEGVYAKLGAPRSTLRFNPYGIEPLDRIYARSANGPLRFGFMGNAARHKGAVELARCFRAVSNATLTFFGPAPRGMDLVNVCSAASEQTVQLHGPYEHADLLDVLRTIDVLVVSSVWQENSPIVIHEALCAGIPVLAFDSGGIAELVRPGINGWLVPCGDFPALRNKIVELAGRPVEVDRMSLGAALVRSINDDAAGCIEMARA